MDDIIEREILFIILQVNLPMNLNLLIATSKLSLISNIPYSWVPFLN